MNAVNRLFEKSAVAIRFSAGLICLWLASLAPATAPAQELRGAWLTRDALASATTIAQAMDNLAANNFNIVYVDAWTEGYPLWNSQTFSNQTGLAIDPGFAGRDIMAEVVAEGHRDGLQVVAWFEYGFAGGYSGYLPGSSGKGVIFDANPEWLAMQVNGTEIDSGDLYWMAQTRPDVQQFLISLASELATNYDLDGVELDRCFYSTTGYGYDSYTTNLYALQNGGQTPPLQTNNAAWIQWRANNLSLFVSNFYSSLKSLRPLFTVANTPSAYSANSYSAYTSFCQDWVAWVNGNTVDNVQVETYVSPSSSFSNDLRYVASQVNNLAKVQPSFAIAPNSTYIPYSDITNFVNAARNLGFSGEVVWYYDALATSNYFSTLKTANYPTATYPGYLPADWRNYHAITLISNTTNAVRTGAWTSSANAGYSGNSYYAASSPPAAIDYYSTVPTNGVYEIYAFQVISSNRSTNAQYVAFDAAGNAYTNTINQTLANNSRWVKLGDFLLAAGRQHVARVSNSGAASGQLTSADALLISLNRRLSVPPVLAAVSNHAAGQPFQLQLSGNAGQRLLVQTSSNLITWNTLTNVVLSRATNLIQDASATNATVRFYRVSIQPH